MNISSAYLMLIIAALLWSLGGLFIKLVDLSPIIIAGIRSLGAAVVFIFYIKKPKWYWGKYFIGGILFYSSMVILYVVSIRLTTAANAIFLQFTAPLWVVIFGYFILKETVSKFDILAMLFIFLGMGLFFIDDLTFYGFWGNIMALVSGICFALVTVLIRKEKDYAFEIVLFGNLITALICFPFILEGFGGSSKLDLLIIFALGVFQLGIPYLLYTKALKYVKAIDAILTGMIEPVLNPIWVFIFIGEVIGEWAFIGGLMVLIGSLGRAYFKQKIEAKIL
ncbi:MAG: DMT family transporter [Candidatus Marinimicrobia bacterium]|nr:DMT family transporter [Candidatus Neomarinimicrobiota bacterium]